MAAVFELQSQRGLTHAGWFVGRRRGELMASGCQPGLQLHRDDREGVCANKLPTSAENCINNSDFFFAREQEVVHEQALPFWIRSKMTQVVTRTLTPS